LAFPIIRRRLFPRAFLGDTGFGPFHRTLRNLAALRVRKATGLRREGQGLGLRHIG